MDGQLKVAADTHAPESLGSIMCNLSKQKTTSPFVLCQQPELSGPRCLSSRLWFSIILLLVSGSPARPKAARMPHILLKCTSALVPADDGVL